MTWARPSSRLVYQVRYVVYRGKARIILNALFTPSEATENRLMPGRYPKAGEDDLTSPRLGQTLPLR